MTRNQATRRDWSRAVSYARHTLRAVLGRKPGRRTIERVAARALQAIPVPRRMTDA
ncbi:MAG: hypothetical protein AB7K52_10335 [Phycisphaerales bacterium]